MAKKDDRAYEFKIRQLELEVKERQKELLDFKLELSGINEQLEKFISQMSEQLKLATLIQRSLVPTEIPTIPGFEFSTKFVASSVNGSDYFDIFEMEDKLKFGVLMATSTGHGMASLFLSVLLKIAAQVEARKGLEPDQVLKKMNEEVQGKVKEAQAAHVFYGVVDRRDHSLKYTLSGDISALVYKHSADKYVILPQTQGMLVGKSGKANFKTEGLNLDPRDRLILTSTGFPKVKNKKDEEFGDKRLQKFLVDHTGKSCHEMRNEVLFQAKQFAQGEPYPQDLSVIVMGVKDKVAKLKRV